MKEDAIIPGAQKIDNSAMLKVQPAQIPDSIKGDYVKSQLWKQGQILEAHTEMIATNGQATTELAQASAEFNMYVSGIVIFMLTLIIVLQYAILRKKI